MKVWKEGFIMTEEMKVYEDDLLVNGLRQYKDIIIKPKEGIKNFFEREDRHLEKVVLAISVVVQCILYLWKTKQLVDLFSAGVLYHSIIIVGFFVGMIILGLYMMYPEEKVISVIKVVDSASVFVTCGGLIGIILSYISEGFGLSVFLIFLFIAIGYLFILSKTYLEISDIYVYITSILILFDVYVCASMLKSMIPRGVINLLLRGLF